MKSIKRIRVLNNHIFFELETKDPVYRKIHLIFRENDLSLFEHIFEFEGNHSLEIPSELEGKRVRVIEVIDDYELFHQSIFLPKRPKLFNTELIIRISKELESDIMAILAKGTM